MYNKYCKERNSEAKKKCHDEFKLLRNEVKNKIKFSKKQHYAELFRKNSSNMAEIWKGIKSIVNLNNKSGPTCIRLKKGEQLLTSPLDTANHFNEYFSSVGQSLAAKIRSSRFSYRHFLKNSPTFSFYLKPVNSAEIKKMLISLNKNKSTGPNNILTHLLKDHADEFSHPLSILVNNSFRDGVFPSLCKVARVIPVFKKGDPNLVSNYRPISLLSIFSKIFEKCFYKRLYSFLTKYNLIFMRQFGFRSGFSTNHALATIVETIKAKLDERNYVCGIFIDLQKAFDTVDHEILLQKLNFYGIRGMSNEWLRSFLSDRFQHVSSFI